jgi:ferrous iron transport protein A
MKTNFNFDAMPEAAGTPAAPDSSALESLSELAPGRMATIVSIDDSGPVGRRLLDLGLLPGTVVQALRHAPLGDPAVFELRGYRLCLRRSETNRIRVAPMDPNGST